MKSLRIVMMPSMLVFLSVLGSTPTPVQADHLTCGSTVDGVVDFDSDLNCVNSDGLKVGADGTTINLNGFSLTCTGLGYRGSCQGLGFGGLQFAGLNSTGFSDIQFNGPGTIDGFKRGVFVSGGSNVTVQNLNVTGPPSPGALFNNRPPATGIFVRLTLCPDPPATTVNISGIDVSNHREGIELFGANCVNVADNNIHDNNADANECHGILLHDSGNNSIFSNLVERNGENIKIDGGITLDRELSANNTIMSNDVSNNCGDGISARRGANNNVIASNIARNNSTSTFMGQCREAFPGDFFDLAGRGSGAGNMWDENNLCNTQNEEIPPGVCNPDK